MLSRTLRVIVVSKDDEGSDFGDCDNETLDVLRDKDSSTSSLSPTSSSFKTFSLLLGSYVYETEHWKALSAPQGEDDVVITTLFRNTLP